MALMTFFGFLALWFLSAMWRGLVLVRLWAWFIVPTFAAPSLTIPVACGISLIVTYLTHQSHKGSSGSWVVLWTQAFLVPLLTLAVAWVVTLFI